MPISKYFGGKGEKIMSSMEKTYGKGKKAKQVFYAMANKRGEKPGRTTDRAKGEK